MSNKEIKILNRVSSLPIVTSALGYGASRYAQIKQSNPILQSSLSMVENTVAFAASSAAPVVSKLNPSLIAAADDYACEALNKLEEKIPAIKSSPQEVYTNAQSSLTGLKDYGMARIQSAYDTNVAPTLDSAMSLTIRAVDVITGSEEDTEYDKAMKSDKSVIRRAGYVSEKLRRRVTDQVLKRLRSLPASSSEAIKSMYTVDFIQYAKAVDAKAGVDAFLDLLTKVAGKNVTDQVVKLSKKASSTLLENERLPEYGRRYFSAASAAFNGLVCHVSTVYAELKNTPREQIPAFAKKHIGISADLLSGWIQSTFGAIIPLHWFESGPDDQNKTTDANSRTAPDEKDQKKEAEQCPMPKQSPTHEKEKKSKAASKRTKEAGPTNEPKKVDHRPQSDHGPQSDL